MRDNIAARQHAETTTHALKRLNQQYNEANSRRAKNQLQNRRLVQPKAVNSAADKVSWQDRVRLQTEFESDLRERTKLSSKSNTPNSTNMDGTKALHISNASSTKRQLEKTLDEKLNELPYSNLFTKVEGPLKRTESNGLKSMAGKLD